MSKTSCVICKKHADAGKSLRTTCGHWTHTECLRELNKPKDFDKCAQCLGYIKELDTGDGIDYVMNPPTIEKVGILRSAAAKALSLLSSRNDLPEGVHPLALLSQGPYQMPITSIIKDHGVGLQHMIKNGVTIDDFVANGYSLDDLRAFKDFSGERGQQRAQHALCALKMTADHLKEYGDSLLPIEDLRNDFGITPQVICSMYELECPEGGYVLASPASEDWTAKDVLALGFTMDDLLEHAKMEYQEQYFALEPTQQQERALKVRSEHADRLKPLEIEKEDEQPEDITTPEADIAQPLYPTQSKPIRFKQLYDAPQNNSRIRRTRHGLRKK